VSTLRSGFARLEAELAAEHASVLGRIGRRLEACLADLEQLRQDVLGARGAARAELVAQHGRLRREAKRLRWYLLVQREALGFRRNADLGVYYPIPAALD
jgi:hypothetical protein